MREDDKRYQGGVASTEDFLATVTEVAGAAPSAACGRGIFDVGYATVSELRITENTRRLCRFRGQARP